MFTTLLAASGNGCRSEELEEGVRGADQLSMKCLLSSHTMGAEIRACGQFKLLIPPVTPFRDASARSSVVKPCRRRSLYSPVGTAVRRETRRRTARGTNARNRERGQQTEGGSTGRLGHAPHRVVRRGVRLEADEVAATLRRLREISNALTAWTLQLG